MGLPSVWNNDVGQASLVSSGGSAPPEMYIPLWWYSGLWTRVSTSAFGYYATKGVNNFSTTIQSNNTMINLSSNWKSNQKFAFEASLWTDQSGATVYAELTDMSSGGSQVTTSQVSTTATTATVVRSSQFTLTPGHSYGISIWGNLTSGYYAYITDASLIVFPS